MNDTRHSDEWIKDAISKNPCVTLADGQIRTCPVRLSFPHIFERQEPMEPGKQGAYGASLLFPVGADLTPLYSAAGDAAKAKWPNLGGPGGPKIKTPFLKQDDMMNYGAFVEGGVYIRAVAYKNRPPVFNKRHQPVTDESAVYPGVWAVCIVNPFTYEQKVNKGVSFGLNGLLLYEDDEQLGGGGVNPESAFAGLQIDASVSPAAAFGGPAADPFAAFG
jgi:hypothetical protein